MSAEEFFQVLYDSQLYRAFPWYYQGAGPLIVLAIAAACWVYILYGSGIKALQKWKDLKNLSGAASLNPPNDLLRDATFHLILAQAVAATLTVSVPWHAWRIQRNPITLLQAIDPGLDSLYDLTPVGVQFVVNYLFWTTILSLVAALSLWIVASGGLLFQIVQSRVVFNPKRILVPGVLFAPLLVMIVVLNVRYFDLTAGNQLSGHAEASEPRSACQASEEVKVIEQDWREATLSNGSPGLHGRLVVRFPHKGSYPVGLTLLSAAQLPLLSSQVLTPSGQYDPLEITIYPMLDAELTPVEKQFAADVLRETVSHFDLGDSKDRVWLHLSKHSTIDKKLLAWPSEVANEVFTWSADADLDQIDFLDDLEDVVAELPDEPVEGSQSDLPPLLILFRWYPRQAPDFLYDAGFYNELNKDGKFRLWIIDLITTGPTDGFESELEAAKVAYLSVPVPPALVDPNTGKLNIEPVKQRLEQLEKRSGIERIGRRIGQLRPTREITFTTTRVFASQDSPGFRLSVDTSSRCDYRLLLSAIIISPWPDDGVTPVSSPFSATSRRAALWARGVVYPIAIVFATLVWMLGKLPFARQSDEHGT